MTAIHAIRAPLTDLSNMVGMTTIKQTIVDQILYYLQDLHIPETKPNESSKKATRDEQEKTTSNSNGNNDNITDDDLRNHLNETVKNIFNPFAASFQGTSATTIDFKPPPLLPPFNIKKPSSSDEFALPTKGDFMHTVIYGPPGSGKTEVAKIIGRIFSNLGILNKKIFKKVSRNDLVAGYLGQTAIKTKDMIKASLGGVLFIDEAYSLGNSEKKDSFAKECVDTLCEALSEHKHNWMVIIAGYEKELNDCFFSLNEGLNSRFTWRFKLDPYKPSELKSIYVKQVSDYGWKIATAAGAVPVDTDILPLSWFESHMDYFTTYGRDMETLFTKTKIAHSRRVFCLPICEKKIITFADLENGFKLFIENPEVKDRKERGGGGSYMKTLYL
jgi:SpoVK/Ycf46/Vps4 family AAA+-type ATPase